MNLPFSEWAPVIPDPRLVGAIIDRVTFNAHIIETGTDSPTGSAHQQDQHDSVPQRRLTGCDAVGMRSDGRALPDLTQTLVLHRLGLIRSDELPDLAARWLAAGMTDTESTRMLACDPGTTHGAWTSCSAPPPTRPARPRLLMPPPSRTSP